MHKYKNLKKKNFILSVVQVPIQGFVSCNWVIVFGWGFRENALTIFALLSMYNKNIRWASSPSASNLSTLFSNAIINKILIIIIVLVIIIIISLNGILMILIQGQVRSEMQSDCAMKTNTFALRHFHIQLSKTRKNKSTKTNTSMHQQPHKQQTLSQSQDSVFSFNSQKQMKNDTSVH